jgi:hypothetical protein
MTQTGYIVREADLDRDREAIVAVWARNLRAHTASEHWEKFAWYYLHNPVGRGRCWVLEQPAGGEVVGTAGLGMRRLRANGRSLRAGLASDFAVDVKHRLLRPALMLQRAVLGGLQDGLEVIYGLPNRQSLPVFRHVGYSTNVVATRYVKVLRVGRFLKRMFPRVAAARNIVAGVVDPFLRAVSLETSQSMHAAKCGLKRFDDVDERFDELWRRTAGDAEAAGERTAAYLRWRYLQYPFRRYVVLGLTSGCGGGLMGYVVCLPGADEQVHLIDFWPTSLRRSVDQLLARVIIWARARGAASVACEVSGAWRLEKALCRFGFVRRAEGATIASKSLADGNTGVEIPSGHGLYFLQGDGDYD